MKIPFRVTCKQATALLIAQEDREIGMGDKVACACTFTPAKPAQILSSNFDHAQKYEAVAKLQC